MKVLGAILVLFFLWTPSGFANIFYRDLRQSIDPAQERFELRAIGTLSRLQSEGRGTAFLVSPCLILTNRHVAFSNFEDPDMNEKSLFRLTTGESSVAHPLIYGKEEWHGDFENAKDWALLKLESCLGQDVGWFELKPVALNYAIFNHIELEMAGYPADRAVHQVTLHSGCYIKNSGWRHDCATRSGNSGSPIFIKDASAGRPHVIAIAASSIGGFQEIVRDYDVYLSNGAVPVSGFIDRIMDYIQTDKALTHL